MQHQEALSVIRRLGPELTKQAAESVLLRYAESEDLSPAQLEKLAQAYNMARQLDHIDASEDRGSTCHQIDTPSLLRTYVAGTQKAAAATPQISTPTHDASAVNLMLELRREMSGMSKAASADSHSESLEITHPSVPAPSPEADIRFTPEQFKEAAWEAKVDFYAAADAILKMAKCEGRQLQIAEAERDAMRLANPVCVSEALNWLEKYAGQQKLSRTLFRHEGPVKAAAFNLTSPLADKIVELAGAFTLTSLFHKVASGAGIELGNMPKSDAVNAQGQSDVDEEVMRMLMEEFPAPEPGKPPGPIGGGDPTKGLQESATRIRAAEKEREKEQPERSERSSGGKTEKSEKPSTEPATKSPNWLAAIISGATKPVSAATGTVIAAGEGAKGAIRNITGKERVHKEQLKLDQDVGDIRRSILIRRLAANDPVLRDIPLQQVLDTYNAIAETNPAVASNPRRVLLAMREAASYEGVTLDAQKQLADVRSADAKTDAAEADNAKRRYSA